MTGLRELQHQFSQHILNPEHSALFSELVPGAFDPAQRIQVYRNNMAIGLTDAMGAVYPVIHRLVGDEFFQYCCREFMRCFPSRCGNLHDFGREFSAFLKDFKEADSLPYLSDVAELEWNYHVVYHEAEAQSLDLEALSRVNPDSFEALKFELNPACRIMRSRYPIAEIWRVNQDEYDGDQRVNLDSGACNLLLIRNREEIEIHNVDDASYAALTHMQRGDPLEQCLGAALEVEDDFNLNFFLSRFAGNRTIVAFSVS